MRAVTAATAAHVLGISPRELHNLLRGRGQEPGLDRRQGLARRFSLDDVALCRVAIDLTHQIGLPSTQAFAVADRLLKNDGAGVQAGRTLLSLDRASLYRELTESLASALEEIVPPPRGRPVERD